MDSHHSNIKLIQGDALSVLKTLPDNSIDCVMTSPPYFNQRDYEIQGQIGIESSIDQYLTNLCNVFKEVKRILAPHGTCFVNIGDSYINKSLCQIPARFSIKMCDSIGYLLRNELIWKKSNCVPSSVRDRYTIEHESLFYFTKQGKHYFKTQYENCVNDNKRKRIKRSVWDIPTSKTNKLHFATYPVELCQSPIDGGCPMEVCNVCGKPREVIWKPLLGIKQEDRMLYKQTKKCKNKLNEVNTAPKADQIEQYIEDGYTDCGHNDYRRGIVLDPFNGTGTTGVAALTQNKDYIGIELSEAYCKITEERLSKIKKG